MLDAILKLVSTVGYTKGQIYGLGEPIQAKTTTEGKEVYVPEKMPKVEGFEEKQRVKEPFKD